MTRALRDEFFLLLSSDRRTDGGPHSAWQKRGMDGDPSGDDDGSNGGARFIIMAYQSSMVFCETFCSTKYVIRSALVTRNTLKAESA